MEKKPFHLTWKESEISNLKFGLNGKCPRCEDIIYTLIISNNNNNNNNNNNDNNNNNNNNNNDNNNNNKIFI